LIVLKFSGSDREVPFTAMQDGRDREGTLTRPPPGRAGTDSRIFLSVGGFANINGGAAFDAVAAGLQAELIRGLSQDPEITVRSGRAEEGQPATDEARFGARFRLSGSLQRVGGGMRIDAKLVDVATGDHLWVERYEGEATPEFQRVVAGLIGSQVRVNLMLGKFSLRDKAPPDGPEVRQIVNSAIVSFFRQTPESLAEAITLAERALAVDPSSMRARRTLAAAISASITLGELPRVAANLERALALAEEVVQAVPQDEIARCELAWALTNLGRHGEAADHLRVAVDLNPASPNARADLAEQLAILGQPREALDQVRLAMATSGSDPLEIWRHHTMAISHFALGDDRAALEVTRHMVRAEPGFTRGVLFWAASAAALGLEEEAGRAATHLLAIAPQFRLAELSPTYLTSYVDPEHQARLLEMLGRAGLA
jgi:TolB-like protein